MEVMNASVWFADSNICFGQWLDLKIIMKYEDCCVGQVRVKCEWFIVGLECEHVGCK